MPPFSPIFDMQVIVLCNIRCPGTSIYLMLVSREHWKQYPPKYAMMLHNCQEQFFWSLLSLLRVQWIKVLSENYFPQMYVGLNINSDDLWSYMPRQSLMFSSELSCIDLSSQHSEEWHPLNEIQEVTPEVWKSCGLKILIKIDSCCYLQFLVFLFISLLSEQGAILYFAKMSHNPMKLGKIHLQSTLSLVFQCIGLL